MPLLFVQHADGKPEPDRRLVRKIELDWKFVPTPVPSGFEA
jgi:hypothetical protein